MKNFFSLSLLLVLVFISYTAEAVRPKVKVDPSATIAYKGIENMTIESFLDLNPKKIKEETGQKLKLKEKIVLKLVQRDIRKKVKKNEVVNFEEDYAAAKRNFNLGGFLLGFFFSLLGVLVALLFGKDAVRSAWKGFLVGLLVGLLIILL